MFGISVGGNLVADTAIRKKLAGRDTGVELQIVLEDLLNSWDTKADKPEENDGTVTVEKQEEGKGGEQGGLVTVSVHDFTECTVGGR